MANQQHEQPSLDQLLWIRNRSRVPNLIDEYRDKEDSSSEPNDPAVLASTSFIPNRGKETIMTAGDTKSKIKALENQIGQMKKTDIEKSVCFSNLCMFLDIEYYPHNFWVSKFKKYKRVDCQ